MARILIVDDSIVSRSNLRKILEEAGHEVAGEAADGADGLEQYRQLQPELVTMDITMPGMSGLDCLQRIVEQDPEAKVVMMTAIGQGPKIVEALERGARHYVTKPFETEKVVEAINDVLEA
jgi:two-component system, chemotaxis family, chemotaxis protein CheY